MILVKVSVNAKPFIINGATYFNGKEAKPPLVESRTLTNVWTKVLMIGDVVAIQNLESIGEKDKDIRFKLSEDIAQIFVLPPGGIIPFMPESKKIEIWMRGKDVKVAIHGIADCHSNNDHDN